MKPRILQDKIRSALTRYPVVAVTGPRQSGKSTLIRGMFPDRPYANLESSRELDFALLDPQGFLQQFPKGCIIDEVQKAPKLLSNIQVVVDDQKSNGMFLLSGSENLQLSQGISQSLAGRILTLKLLPLTISETRAFDSEISNINNTMYTGFYPRIFDQDLAPTETYGAYVETYIERDVRNILQIKDLSKFRRFVELAAGRTGQLLNKDSLASEIGIGSVSIESWISVLEATFLCFRLQPWHANLKKRLVKSPKLYFSDVGLASYLIGINSVDQLRTHPLRGALFESMQVIEAQKYLFNRNLHNRMFFYRDSRGFEVDLVIQLGAKYIPIEIKSSSTYNQDFLKGIEAFSKIQKIEHPAVVLAFDKCESRKDVSLIPWHSMESYLSQKI